MFNRFGSAVSIYNPGVIVKLEINFSTFKIHQILIDESVK